MTNFPILRVERLKSFRDVHAATAHGMRQDRGTHYDPRRTPLNRHWLENTEVDDPIDWGLAIEARIERDDLHVRKNGPAAAELLLTASPAYFFQQDGSIDEVVLEKWLEANRSWLNDRFPGMVLAMRLDLDESAPHLSVLLLPTYQKKTKHQTVQAISYRQVFCGADKYETSEKMIALQDDYAEAMKPLGLTRGIPKAVTGREHLTHIQYVARKAKEDAERRQALEHAQASKYRAEREELKLRNTRRELEKMHALKRKKLRALYAIVDKCEAQHEQMDTAMRHLAKHMPKQYTAAGLEADLSILKKLHTDIQQLGHRAEEFGEDEVHVPRVR